MWQFGANNCCHRFRKVAQSAIKRPVWSHLRISYKCYQICCLSHSSSVSDVLLVSMTTLYYGVGSGLSAEHLARQSGIWKNSLKLFPKKVKTP